MEFKIKAICISLPQNKNFVKKEHKQFVLSWYFRKESNPSLKYFSPQLWKLLAFFFG